MPPSSKNHYDHPELIHAVYSRDSYYTNRFQSTMPDFEDEAELQLCSRCKMLICTAKYLCNNGHYACENCRTSHCRICKHIFVHVNQVIRYPSNNVIFNSGRTSDNCYSNFLSSCDALALFQNGLSCYQNFNTKYDFDFKWTFNPHEGVIEITLSPHQVAREHLFIVEFLHPCNFSKRIIKEWYLTPSIKVPFYELNELDHQDRILCKIYIHDLSIGNEVRTMEDKIGQRLLSVFKRKMFSYIICFTKLVLR